MTANPPAAEVRDGTANPPREAGLRFERRGFERRVSFYFISEKSVGSMNTSSTWYAPLTVSIKGTAAVR
jgi:hypothetical protein